MVCVGQGDNATVRRPDAIISLDSSERTSTPHQGNDSTLTLHNAVNPGRGLMALKAMQSHNGASHQERCYGTRRCKRVECHDNSLMVPLITAPQDCERRDTLVVTTTKPRRKMERSGTVVVKGQRRDAEQGVDICDNEFRP